MRRIVSFSLCLILGIACSIAAPISQNQALRIAESFLLSSPTRSASTGLVPAYIGGKENGTFMKLTRIATNTNDSAPTFYVFNREGDNGFVIVSGDDRLSPIIAYADEGHFATSEEELPEHIERWMQNYSSYVEAVRAGKLAPAESLMVTTRATEAIEPLLTTQWSQDAPYNWQCPLLSTGNRSVTGCTATAIAQIMKYHNWPDKGIGSNTHAGITINYANSQYDWKNMLDRYTYGSYSTTQGNAVAKLMLDIGIAVWMSYGESSGAQNPDIYGALYRHFKYSKKVKFVMRGSYSTAEWIQLLRNELTSKRPVYYGGYTEDGQLGHAFVCDGMDAYDFLHINWGWGGSCDGYFHLNFMNPETPGIGGGEGGYNTDQTAIIGIEPATEDESNISKQAVLSIRSYYRTSTSRIGVGKKFNTNVSDIWSQGPGSCTFQAATALYKDGEFQEIVSEKKSITLQMWGWQTDINLGVTIHNEIPDGKYELRVVTSVDDQTWEEVGYLYYCYQRAIPIEISEGMVYINQPEHSGINMSATADETTNSTNRLPGKNYTAEFTLTNISNRHFNGEVKYEIVSIPPTPSDEFTTTEQSTDTVSILSGTSSYFLYSGGDKALSFNYKLSNAGLYRIVLSFKDPLSQQYIRFAEFPFEISSPQKKYSRKVVFEQLVSTIDGQSPAGYVAFEEMLKQYPTDFIGINIHYGSGNPLQSSNYAQNINLGTTVSARVNRTSENLSPSFEDYEKKYLSTKQEIAIADIELSAKYQGESSSLIEATLSATFAYDIKKADYRFSIITIERNLNRTATNYKQANNFAGGTTPMGGYENLTNPVPAELMTYDWIARNFYPTTDFNGAENSLPEEIKAGETHSHNMRITLTGIREKQNTMLVGLLIDAETGEICNATLLPYNEIAPAEGDTTPIKVEIPKDECTINVGISALIEASVIPHIAPNRLIWESTNPDIATIAADGTITALTPGETFIYAICADSTLLADTLKLTVQPADYTQTQKVEAGYLHYLVSKETIKQADTLFLSGELNGTDIRLLRSISGTDGNLANLNLSAARIVSGGLPYYETYETVDDQIGEKMFYACHNLKTLVIPTTTTVIGNNAFNQCSNLKQFFLPPNVASIGYAPFYGCAALAEFTSDNENKKYRVISNTLMNYARSEIIAYPAGNTASDYTTPSGTRIIHPFAFSGAIHLKTIVTQRTFTTAGYAAFDGCSNLERIELKSRTAEIADYAFKGCTALQRIVCESTTPPVCSEKSFSTVNTETCYLHVPEASIEDYRIAEGWNLFFQISDLASSIKTIDRPTSTIVTAENGYIIINSQINNQPVTVYTTSGLLIAKAVTDSNTFKIPIKESGFYIVHLPQQQFKVYVRD